MLLAWGPSNLDYALLNNGLKLAGHEDLVPPEPLKSTQPFSWWSSLRQSLRATTQDMSLCLSRVYRGLYPQDRRLLLQAHNAGADVKMLMRIIQSYFARVQGLPMPGMIENYCFEPLETRGL